MTSTLTAQLEETKATLAQLWDNIGHDEQFRTNQLDALNQSILQVYTTYVQASRDKQSELETRVATLNKQQRDLRKYLCSDEESVNPEGTLLEQVASLEQVVSQLRETYLTNSAKLQQVFWECTTLHRTMGNDAEADMCDLLRSELHKRARTYSDEKPTEEEEEEPQAEKQEVVEESKQESTEDTVAPTNKNARMLTGCEVVRLPASDDSVFCAAKLVSFKRVEECSQHLTDLQGEAENRRKIVSGWLSKYAGMSRDMMLRVEMAGVSAEQKGSDYMELEDPELAEFVVPLNQTTDKLLRSAVLLDGASSDKQDSSQDAPEVQDGADNDQKDNEATEKDTREEEKTEKQDETSVLCNEIGCDCACTFADTAASTVCGSCAHTHSSAIELQMPTLIALHRRIRELKDIRRRREVKIHGFARTITAFWDELEVTEKERLSFLKKNSGLSIRTLAACLRERIALDEKRGARMQGWVIEAWGALVDAWEQVGIRLEDATEDTPARFVKTTRAAMHKQLDKESGLKAHKKTVTVAKKDIGSASKQDASGVYKTDTCPLASCQFTLQSLRDGTTAVQECLASLTEIRELYGKRRALLTEKGEFDALEGDPKRFKIAGYMIKEQKFRKKFAKLAPKYRAKLISLIEAYDNQHQYVLDLDGVNASECKAIPEERTSTLRELQAEAAAELALQEEKKQARSSKYSQSKLREGSGSRRGSVDENAAPQNNRRGSVSEKSAGKGGKRGSVSEKSGGGKRGVSGRRRAKSRATEV